MRYRRDACYAREGRTARQLGINSPHARVAPVLSEGMCVPIPVDANHTHRDGDIPFDRHERQSDGNQGLHEHVGGTHHCIYNPHEAGIFL